MQIPVWGWILIGAGVVLIGYLKLKAWAAIKRKMEAKAGESYESDE
ncbi:MAG: hypothetical protein ACLFNQ_09085 [Spirochaetaceae bacterium]